MSILKVARMGHPVLRQRTTPVDKHEIRTDAFQKLIDDMIETMDEYSGIGLAAPQVHEGKRLFVAILDGDGDGDGEAIALINPEITIVANTLVEGWEGCLSIPDIRGRVPRSPHIRVSALNREGKRIEIEARDFPARVVQHETDHLDGVLFFDRMRGFESLSYMEEYSRYHLRPTGDEDDD
jgi:peptide deformylase